MSSTEERLLINLHILGQLQPFQRVNAKAELLGIETYSLFNSMARWMRSDDRSIALRRISEIIAESKKIINTSESEHLKLRVQKSCFHALRGLENLKQTYDNDITIVAHLHILTENIMTLFPKAWVDNNSCEKLHVQIGIGSSSEGEEDSS